MSEKLTPAVWSQRIERSKKVKKQYIDDKNSYLALYTNAVQENRRGKRDTMQVNYIYSHIRLVGPSIFAGKPKVTALPRKPGQEEQAFLLGKAIDYWAKEVGAAAEFKSALFDSFFGIAAIEVGWDYKTEIVQQEVEQQVVDELGNISIQKVLQEAEQVVRDQPFIRWRDSNDIFLDVDVPRRKDGRFIVIRDVVTHSYFMGMKEIPDELKERVKPTVRPEDMARADEVENKRSKDVSSETEWVELHWIWCKESMKRYLMTPSLPNEYLLVTDWPYDIEYEDDPFPITILDSITDHKYPYSWSEFKPAIEHIRELNRMRTNMQYHMKASQPKYLYKKGALTRAQASKWATARPDELIEAQNPEAIIQAPLAQLPAELAGWNNLVQGDLVKITGFIEYDSSPEASTATEASIIEGRSSVRKRARAQEFEQFVTATLAKLGMLLQQFMNTGVMIEIAGEEGSDWVNVTKDMLQGEFNFEIEPGIMEFKNDALRKQQILKFAELMRGNPNVNQRKLAVELSKVFDLDPNGILLKKEEISSPPPEPMITFKPIDLATIPAPDVQAMIVKAALQQNQAIGAMQPPAPPQPEQDEYGPQGVPSVQAVPEVDMEENNPQPMGGKVELPPVQGNAEVQDMSMNY